MSVRIDSTENALFDLACSGRLDDASRARLQALLKASPEARERYLDYTALHADLFGAVRAARVRDRFAATLDAQPNVQPLVTVPPVETVQPMAAGRRTGRRRASYGLLGAALATAAGLALVLNLKGLDRGVDPTPSVAAAEEGEGQWRGLVARVNRLEAVEWQPGGKQFGVADLLAAGEAVTLASGIVEVEFRQGAVVVLEGPAHLIANNANAASLLQGKLAAVAPPWATGFRVDTPGVDVVDHGTEFAVNVSGDGAGAKVNVVVTEGEVEVLADEQVEGGRRLRAGEGVNSTDGAVEDGDDAAARQLTEQLPERPQLKNAIVIGDRWADWRKGEEGKPCRDGAWRYFTNRQGAFGEPKNYEELIWDEAENCYLAAGRTGGEWLNKYVRVHREGGHPGRGRDQVWDKIDRYSIAGFVVPEDGVYRIEAGWLERLWAKRWDRDDVLDVAVHVNDGPIVMRELCDRTCFLAFRQELGQLAAGDTIYVGVGPNGADFNDKFRWGFYVVREIDSSEGSSEPSEADVAATD